MIRTLILIVLLMVLGLVRVAMASPPPPSMLAYCAYRLVNAAKNAMTDGDRLRRTLALSRREAADLKIFLSEYDRTHARTEYPIVRLTKEETLLLLQRLSPTLRREIFVEIDGYPRMPNSVELYLRGLGYTRTNNTLVAGVVALMAEVDTGLLSGRLLFTNVEDAIVRLRLLRSEGEVQDLENSLKCKLSEIAQENRLRNPYRKHLRARIEGEVVIVPGGARLPIEARLADGTLLVRVPLARGLVLDPEVYFEDAYEYRDAHPALATDGLPLRLYSSGHVGIDLEQAREVAAYLLVTKKKDTLLVRVTPASDGEIYSHPPYALIQDYYLPFDVTMDSIYVSKVRLLRMLRKEEPIQPALMEALIARFVEIATAQRLRLFYPPKQAPDNAVDVRPMF